MPGGTQSASGRSGGSFTDNSVTPDPFDDSHTFFGNVWRFFVWGLIANIHTDLEIPFQQDVFTHVPISSSLDIPIPTLATFNRSYIFPIDGQAGSRASRYIAQEKFTGLVKGTSATMYNLNHTDFTKRNSRWLYNEMEGLTNNVGCTQIDDCYLPVMQVSYTQNDCNNATITAGVTNGSSYNWQASGDLFINGTSTTLTTTSNTINITGTQGSVYVITSVACGNAQGWLDYSPFQRQIQGLYPEYTSGDHVSVSVNTTPYDTYYRWYINNTLVGEGEYAYSYCTCYNGIDPRVCGENTIRVEVEISCGVTSSFDAGFYRICGYYIMQSNVELYPNPTSSQVNVYLKEPKNKINNGKASNGETKIINLIEISNIKIVDKLGNLKKYLKFGKGNKKVTFNIYDLRSDVYYLEVSDGINKVRIPLSVSK